MNHKQTQQAQVSRTRTPETLPHVAESNISHQREHELSLMPENLGSENRTILLRNGFDLSTTIAHLLVSYRVLGFGICCHCFVLGLQTKYSGTPKILVSELFTHNRIPCLVEASICTGPGKKSRSHVHYLVGAIQN